MLKFLFTFGTLSKTTGSIYSFYRLFALPMCRDKKEESLDNIGQHTT